MTALDRLHDELTRIKETRRMQTAMLSRQEQGEPRTFWPPGEFVCLTVLRAVS